MIHLNKVLLIGELTRDPELVCLPIDDDHETRFGLCNKSESGSIIVEVSTRDRAEYLHRYATKGDLLYVEGRLRLESRESDTGDGGSRLVVVARRWEFLTDRKGRKL